MIYTDEAHLRYDTKWQNAVPWVTPVCHFGVALKLFSDFPPQILRDASNKSLNTQKCSQIHHVMMYTLEAEENFKWKIKKWCIPVDSYVYL